MKANFSMSATAILIGIVSSSGCDKDMPEAMPTQQEVEIAQKEAQQDARKRGWIDVKPLTVEDMRKSEAEAASTAEPTPSNGDASSGN